MELLTVPLYRLIEQGKINRKQFEKRVGRWSAKVDKLEVQAASEVKGLLGDLDKDIRSEITSFADNDSLDRSDINKAIDNAVDKFEAKRKVVMRKTRQKAVDVSHEFRQDVTGMTKDQATSSPMGGKGSKKMVRDLSKMQDEANKGFGKFLRKKIKSEIADGVLKGKTPNEIAKDMVAKRIVTPTRKKGDVSARNALAKAEKFARADVRQTFNAANQVSSAGQKVKGKKKIWIAKMDGIERAAHRVAHIEYGIGGKPGPIPVRRNFKVGGERLMFPGDPKGKPHNIINCRCVSVEITPEADAMISKRGGKRKK
jgi:hypothetical protein